MKLTKIPPRRTDEQICEKICPDLKISYHDMYNTTCLKFDKKLYRDIRRSKYIRCQECLDAEKEEGVK